MGEVEDLGWGEWEVPDRWDCEVSDTITSAWSDGGMGWGYGLGGNEWDQFHPTMRSLSVKCNF